MTIPDYLVPQGRPCACGLYSCRLGVRTLSKQHHEHVIKRALESVFSPLTRKYPGQDGGRARQPRCSRNLRTERGWRNHICPVHHGISGFMDELPYTCLARSLAALARCVENRGRAGESE